MIVWLSVIYSLFLLGITIAALGWIYQRTHLKAVLAYILYAVVSFLWPSRPFEDMIIARNAGQWLGSTTSEQITNYYMLSSAISYTIQTVLLLWLVLSLVNWSRNKGLLPWQRHQDVSSSAPNH